MTVHDVVFGTVFAKELPGLPDEGREVDARLCDCEDSRPLVPEFIIEIERVPWLTVNNVMVQVVVDDTALIAMPEHVSHERRDPRIGGQGGNNIEYFYGLSAYQTKLSWFFVMRRHGRVRQERREPQALEMGRCTPHLPPLVSFD